MEFQILRLSKGDGSVRDFRGVVRKIIPDGTADFFHYNLFIKFNEKHHLNHFSSSSLEYLHMHAGLDVTDRYLTQLPLKVVDMPDSNLLITLIYKIALMILFSFERVFKQPILQTITTKKSESSKYLASELEAFLFNLVSSELRATFLSKA